MNWLYLSLLAVSAIAAWSRVNPTIDRVALAIVANWIINTSFVTLTGIYDPFYWFLAVDAVTAAIILRRPASVAQAGLGASYLIQIAMHTGYGLVWLSNPHEGASYAGARDLYLNWLDWVAYAQLAILALWAGGHGRGRKVASFLRLRRRRMVHHSSSRQGDGQ